ncbi:hypothetical protein F5984_00860 [Rudanella paleaurantiibacter]|uniref:Uncharacterized protein n=1 Tax=Rudanella paleaurantiibacter TaxID=2614655 RepID=A0A7J5U5X5_9BACT|nr:hypothetical protein [Rudanella paleaurantiibacter]KAB7732540.1 hypothetical protein F5984_00860 [Rudanella paleaurantiibacter]
MKIGEKLLKQLSKRYAPSTLVTFRFGRYDVAAKTDNEGNPVLAFVGKADEQGHIKGDQFTRKLLKDETGTVLKDHWDYKGKA